LGFPTGRSFTTHQANFLVPLPGIEEEAPTSTTHSHVNLAPSNNFLAPLPGKSGRPLQGEFFAHTSFTLLLFYFTLFILPASFYIKKPKKIRILGSCYFFTFSSSFYSLSTFWRTSQ
jgi:hypothetical protein